VPCRYWLFCHSFLYEDPRQRESNESIIVSNTFADIVGLYFLAERALLELDAGASTFVNCTAGDQISLREFIFFSDVSVMLVLLILAMIADVVFNIGRITMYSYPLYLPALSAFIDHILNSRNTTQNFMT
jgi:hypothetical protein